MKIVTNCKKRDKENKRLTKEILQLLRKYSLKQWLEFIIDSNKKAEFNVIYIDLAIRISKNTQNNQESYLNENDFYKLITIENKLSSNAKDWIKSYGLASIPFMAYSQNRFNYDLSNSIGRLHTLYKKFNTEFNNDTGLDMSDICLIYLYLKKHIKNFYFKKANLINPKLKNFTFEKITSFLNLFSITQEEYIKKSKSEGIYENKFGKFKYLTRYPIIKLASHLYIIPVLEQLSETLLNNLYFILLENSEKRNNPNSPKREASKKILDEFSLELEKYVLDLGINCFGAKHFKRAKEIVTKENELKCEAIFDYKDNSLAIEVKKMNLKKNALILFSIIILR